MSDLSLWVFAIVCGAIGVPMLIHELHKEFYGKTIYTPRAKYARGER